jgi:putative ABC transport system substrate-binding protein
MRRFHAFVTALLILLASAVAAQTQTKLARIGMLCLVRCTGPGYDAFDGERRKLGWIEGRNLTTERRALEGHYERVREIAADLVRSRPDVIVGPGATVARALKEATSEIPIAFPSWLARWS